MAANPIVGHLPPPHAHISVSVSQWHDTWYVRYSGFPKDLLAAGIVDADMVSKMTSRKGGARFAKDGLPFKLRSGRVPAHIQWARDEQVVFERRGRIGDDLENLLKLPGMLQLFPDGLPADSAADDLPPLRAFVTPALESQFPGISMRTALRIPSVAAQIGTSTVNGWQLRDRRVGRRQTPVEWFAIGKVIAPNWSRLLMDRRAS